MQRLPAGPGMHPKTSYVIRKLTSTASPRRREGGAGDARSGPQVDVTTKAKATSVCAVTEVELEALSIMELVTTATPPAI